MREKARRAELVGKGEGRGQLRGKYLQGLSNSEEALHLHKFINVSLLQWQLVFIYFFAHFACSAESEVQAQHVLYS